MAIDLNAIPAAGNYNTDTLVLRRENSQISFNVGYVDDLAMLAKRLRLHAGSQMPFDFVNVHVGKDKAYVFVVKDGVAVTLEDDHNMYPSDNLITQLRLMIG